jgi:chromosome segregation protein
MIKLNRLVVHGFKSFKRKTSIPIPPGFSVFTGPNGSGKSNIADAFIYVLGKTSAKSLRATRTYDLIFHGSKKKPGSEYAVVSLYFDNSNKALPFDEEEVSISRKTNLKGVSTYRLNGKVVTRQQIIDTLVQIGLHPDGHNIINQGDVTQIVEMDPVERRKILDDVSGIAEYEDKKQKAEKELAKVEEKIKEAEIILREKENIINKLKKERDMALEYQKLNEDLEKIRDAILWKEYNKAKQRLEIIEKKRIEKERLSRELEEEINKLDEELAEEEKKLDAITQRVLKASDEIKMTKKVTALRAEAERLRDKIQSNEREMMRIDMLTDRLRSMDFDPAVKSILDFDGVHGTVINLIKIPAQYSVAVEVSAGRQLYNVVVDDANTAVKCIKHLKSKKIGRAKFLPLDKIISPPKKPLPPGAIGWLSDLIQYDKKYEPVVNYLFGRTACVNNIDVAKEIAEKARIRMVTLDGDLIETSGAMTGGFYKKKSYSDEINKYQSERKRLEEENRVLEKRLKELEAELKEFSGKEVEFGKADVEIRKSAMDARMKKIREKRREAYEKRLVLQQELGKLNIEKARIEAKFEDLSLRVKEGEKDLKPFIDMSVSVLKVKEREMLERMQALGSINLRAIEDFEAFKTEFDDFKEKVDKIVSERNSIIETMMKIEERRKEVFLSCLESIRKHFRETYNELTGGEASLELEDPNNMDSGLLIKAQPPGKKLLHIDSMSGGEKTLTAFAFLFAIQRHKPTPFYILDEADAALDKKNSELVAKLIKKHSKDVQFIIISHNDAIIKEADQVYGVSMQDGESKIFGIKLPEN